MLISEIDLTIVLKILVTDLNLVYGWGEIEKEVAAITRPQTKLSSETAGPYNIASLLLAHKGFNIYIAYKHV
jgi:hypothetical protein